MEAMWLVMPLSTAMLSMERISEMYSPNREYLHKVCIRKYVKAQIKVIFGFYPLYVSCNKMAFVRSASCHRRLLTSEAPLRYLCTRS